MEHLRDEVAEQRRKKQLTLAGWELLEEIERLADSSEPLSRALLGRVSLLPPSDQAELVSMLCAKSGREGEPREGKQICPERRWRPSVRQRNRN